MLLCAFTRQAKVMPHLLQQDSGSDSCHACRWQQKYFEAKTALTGREEKLAAVGDLIERELLLLGCTAIEDKLQSGVPEAIERLANAGIRIWVLTGDKQVHFCRSRHCARACKEYRRAFIVLASKIWGSDIEFKQVDKIMIHLIHCAHAPVLHQWPATFVKRCDFSWPIYDIVHVLLCQHAAGSRHASSPPITLSIHTSSCSLQMALPHETQDIMRKTLCLVPSQPRIRTKAFLYATTQMP